jgi:hypothetical protein
LRGRGDQTIHSRSLDRKNGLFGTAGAFVTRENSALCLLPGKTAQTTITDMLFQKNSTCRCLCRKKFISHRLPRDVDNLSLFTTTFIGQNFSPRGANMNRPNFQKASYVAAMTLALVSAAEAAATRTFVNAETGNDSNTGTNCVATTPCKTLAVAYGVTLSGGEIVVMAPGGYGPITITGPLTILGVDGATSTAQSGTTAITVSAGASDKIYIRNLQITGSNTSNSTGIQLNSGQLTLRDCGVKLLTTGLVDSNTHADVINSDFVGNGTAIQTNGPGVPFNSGIGIYVPGPATTVVRINGGNFVDNTTVFNENNPTATSSSPTVTIWEYSTAPFTTGFTNLMTITGTGSGGNNPGPQGFSVGTPPG